MSMIRKLFAVSAVVAAASLAACGGSDDPVQNAADIPAIAVTAANAAAAKAAVTALISAQAVTLPAVTSQEGVAIPAGTTLKFTPVPTGAASNVISGFELTTGASKAIGVLEIGSCKFTVTTAGAGYAVGDVLTFNPCGIDFNTAGVPANGTNSSVPVTITLGGTPVTVPNVVVTVTVVDGKAQISVPGGGTIGTGNLSTGS